MHSSWLPLAIAMGTLLVASVPAHGQDETKKKADAAPVALVNARVAGYEQPVTILIARGKIRAVDPRARPLPGMRQFNLRGATVVPGRIDAWASAGSPDPLGNSLDAFDPYDEDTIEEALRSGVTTIVLTPMRSSSNSGLAAVLKLKPDATLEERVLVRESAVCTSLGLGNTNAVARATQADGLRRTFAAAEAYRDAWAEYETEIEEYTKALETVGTGKPAKGKPSTAKPSMGRPGMRRPRMGRPRMPLRPVPVRGGSKAPGKPGAKKKDSGPAKPKRPRLDRSKALLVRVLSGELPLRVEAHRAADIVNVLEIAEAFGIRVILEGASEAYLLADVLAKREIPVILGPVLSSSLSPFPFPVRHRATNAAQLDAAGVTVLIGSDAWPASRFVELNAALAVAAGLDPTKGDAAITSGVADLLGLGDRIGRVATGYDADLVVVRTGALGERSVRAVFVDGELAWRAP
jgi:imidazolonepropionase-like amidohydrolase